MVTARISALEALGGGLTAVLTPSFLVLLPIFIAFLVGSLRYELTESPAQTSVRDILVTAFFFSVGFNTIFVILSLASVLGQGVGGGSLPVRVMASVMVALWGVRQISGVRVHIGEDHSRRRLGLDDWPVAAMVGLIIGGAIALSWQAVSGPVLGAIMGLQMLEGTQHGAGFLMALYAMGLAAAITFVGALCIPIMQRLAQDPDRYRRVEMICGVLLCVAALAILANATLPAADGLLWLLPFLNHLG